MPFRIRDAQAPDFPALHALDQACFAPGIAWSKAELQYFLKYPGTVTLVAEEESGRLAGFAIAGIHRRKGDLLGRLITIDIDRAMRRRGLGQILLGKLEERLREAGAKAVMLEVAVDNTGAQQFYDRQGFTRTGRIPGYYLGRIDALVMEKPL